MCKFRHLLEEHRLGEKILGTVNLHLQARGVGITTGPIVDAPILHAPTSLPMLIARSDLLGVEPLEQGRFSKLAVGGEKDTSLGRVFAPTEGRR